MGNNNQINFFWSGDGWSYLHDMTIRSHVRVGHKPVIWIHKSQPHSPYWDPQYYARNTTLRNASYIIDIDGFISKGGNFKTASSLWRFIFLYRYGGWYADTDAVAIRPWPDKEWVVCGEDGKTLSTGVIKVPPGQKMFIGMVGDMKTEWGNVGVFNKHYMEAMGNTNSTVNNKLFYPFKWNEWNNLLSNMEVPEDVYSVHLYHTMFERSGVIDKVDQYIKHNASSIIGGMDRMIRRADTTLSL